MTMKPPRIFNWSNFTTFIRLVILVVSTRYSSKDPVLFIILYTLSAFLDVFDGLVSRWLKEATLVGACFDSVLDRMTTCYLFLVLAIRYPQYVDLIYGFLVVDVFGHWIHNYACALVSNRNHKKVPDANFLLRWYYQSRVLMFFTIIGYEVTIGSFFLLSFPKISKAVHTFANTVLFPSAPFAVYKVLTNVMQGYRGIIQIHLHERALYESAATN